MKSVILILLFFTVTLTESSPVTKQVKAHRFSSPDYKRISSIPDYYQKENRFGTYPLNGSMHCGPVAVSNSLIWLSKNGVASLVPSSGDDLLDQHNIIEKLASKEYMNTRSIGSTVQDLCRGLKKYLDEKAIEGLLLFEGMYTVTDKFRGDTRPDLDRIIKHTKGLRAAWLNIGWYRYDPDTNEYRKTGGHWVTLSGYKNENSSDILIINDPATKERQMEYLEIEPIIDGTIINGNRNFPVNASGFFRFKTGKNRYGIIGGVVYLSLENEEIIAGV
ncbi:MAG: hypothetical protein GXY77_08490 [Fibrobacter sp.]|nr:hypothetical protein [Fibrobacter sp.]